MDKKLLSVYNGFSLYKNENFYTIEDDDKIHLQGTKDFLLNDLREQRERSGKDFLDVLNHFIKELELL
ncbi:hypothetical protein [Paraclostridium sordellii]|uniref:hypothetical protein n=1 Tax=Paraclostridium sordellii TaxID=1505 RepID=UPI000386A723|nr:hypothetical protein [Paeniclostridium sordellii]EPZ61745.1 hypothetical protein H476_3575 [[Clostridium] sordellii VPI 9048] [Paeniclostridium sordellii VPI 9048]CEN26605.1 Uncharacterised protein [[Clostridium] sordellii] [Paeniclostridium sordellii]CEP50440.1 Uncharacterised protein [[Clostridium] sordellii] [Paeniclostridium sordellii]